MKGGLQPPKPLPGSAPDLCRAILNSASCEACVNQIAIYIEFKAIFMNIESISYRSIVNRYTHNDRTLIFARIATLHFLFFFPKNVQPQFED